MTRDEQLRASWAGHLIVPAPLPPHDLHQVGSAAKTGGTIDGRAAHQAVASFDSSRHVLKNRRRAAGCTSSAPTRICFAYRGRRRAGRTPLRRRSRTSPGSTSTSRIPGSRATAQSSSTHEDGERETSSFSTWGRGPRGRQNKAPLGDCLHGQSPRRFALTWETTSGAPPVIVFDSLW